MRLRQEHDLLGFKDVPNEAYWGVHTQRAVENFPISRTTLGAYPALIEALAHIKKAAARTNLVLGILDEKKALAIQTACDLLLNGQYHDQFPVSMLQGGAGTSTNMNANEVIANLGLELLGYSRGDYKALHPNDHVNLGQSTNDVYPSAIRIALLLSLPNLLINLERLEETFRKQGKEYESTLKMGRTQLQEAVPMTVGQEFGAHADALHQSYQELVKASKLLAVLNMGGTAIGTGIAAHKDFGWHCINELQFSTGLPLRQAENLISATSDTGDFVTFSAALKRTALTLSKISNDLRLLSSGPQSGLRELKLPARQAGSSIMPGKVNPVIPEVVNQVAFEIVGYDATICMACENGQLQLNAFEPVIAWSLLKGMQHLANAVRVLDIHCVTDIEVAFDVVEQSVAKSSGLATALAPHIGYEKAVLVVMRAQAESKTVRQVALEMGVASPEELDDWLSLASLIKHDS